MLKHKYIIILAVALLLPQILFAALQPGDYVIGSAAEPAERMPSNSIIDIMSHNNDLWLGSGGGLVQFGINDGSFNVIPSGDLIGRGGISAMSINDKVMWIATAYTEKVSGGYFPAGGGLGFSRDNGNSWTWIDQPVDSVDEENYHPTTTNIQNVTYDIALSNSAVWIVSWGGGIRKLRYDSLDAGIYHWEVMTPDGNPFWALQNLRHRGFSGVFANNAIWIGTAGGVHRTLNEGLSWETFSFEADLPSISGNFVTAMGVQHLEHYDNVWAATWKANNVAEYYGVSVTYDNGTSWQVALSDSTILASNEYLIDKYGPLKVHNFGFGASKVYACADGGLWISSDNGFSWGEPITSITDPTIGETLTDIDFYSADVIGDSVWVGTNAGLVVGWLEGAHFTWRIHRAHNPAGEASVPDTYAYPSPFSPNRGHITRFQVRADAPLVASLKIFSFAMEPVYEFGPVSLPGGGQNDMTGYGAFQWDGKDSDGTLVANGVYFYCIKAAGQTWWGKVMVLD